MAKNPRPFYLEREMTAITQLRLARLQKGWTLDDVFLRSQGKLNPARLSRLERGVSSARAEETNLLITLLGVDRDTVENSGLAFRPEPTESNSCHDEMTSISSKNHRKCPIV
jgi:hypothetical protein